MGIRQWIKDTTTTRRRELAEPGAAQRHEMIASDYHAGRIDRDEYERQRDALIASEAERIRVAEVTDAEANRIQADQEASWEEAREQEPDTPGDTATYRPTSTKPDMFALTSDIRARRGPIYTFNPPGLGVDATEEDMDRLPEYAALSDADRTQYLGDRAAEMSAGDDAAFAATLARMTRTDGIPDAQRRQVVETAHAWRDNEATADQEVADAELKILLAQPPQSAYSPDPDPHEIDEQYWPAPDAEAEAGA
jgi:hypothetical protein